MSALETLSAPSHFIGLNEGFQPQNPHVEAAFFVEGTLGPDELKRQTDSLLESAMQLPFLHGLHEITPQGSAMTRSFEIDGEKITVDFLNTEATQSLSISHNGISPRRQLEVHRSELPSYSKHIVSYTANNGLEIADSNAYAVEKVGEMLEELNLKVTVSGSQGVDKEKKFKRVSQAVNRRIRPEELEEAIQPDRVTLIPGRPSEIGK